MKKRMLSLALALVMCLSLLPVGASAAATLPTTLEAPSAIHIRDEADFAEGGYGDAGTNLWISFNKGADLGNILTTMYESNFGEYYGVQDNAQIKAQLDWSLDSPSNWQYRPYWDRGVNAHDDDANNLPGEFTTINLNPDTTQEEQFFYLGNTTGNWDGDDDWASRIPSSAYTLVPNGWNEPVPVIDWNQHTLYVRMRFLIRYNEIGDENGKFIYSPWSSVVTFGKNAVTYKQPASLEKPTVSELSLADYEWNGGPVFLYKLTNPQSVKDHSGGAPSIGDMIRLETQVNIGGKGWVDVQGAVSVGDGMQEAKLASAAEKVDDATWVQLRARYHYHADPNSDRKDLYSDWSNVVQMGAPAWGNASAWATAELTQADTLGLIPEVLRGADLTKPITRAEFAAVAVKVYENLSSKAALPVVNNPFTDTKDVEVLKAYNIGAVNGTSATTFTPNALLNREQAATMLTRVFKAVTLSGWTLETDAQFKLDYTKPAAFADDQDISAYAKDSVYFMAANGIIGGVGNNTFAPRAVTSAQQAQGYAQATREAALLIAVRMVQNLK